MNVPAGVAVETCCAGPPPRYELQSSSEGVGARTHRAVPRLFGTAAPDHARAGTSAGRHPARRSRRSPVNTVTELRARDDDRVVAVPARSVPRTPMVASSAFPPRCRVSRQRAAARPRSVRADAGGALRAGRSGVGMACSRFSRAIRFTCPTILSMKASNAFCPPMNRSPGADRSVTRSVRTPSPVSFRGPTPAS